MKHRNFIKTVFTLAILMICLSSSYAQLGQNLSNPRNNSSGSEFQIPDSIIMSYFHINELNRDIAYGDTTLDDFFYQFDPLESQAFEYQNLGNTGSSSRDIWFKPQKEIGFHLGQNQYDLYNYTLENLKIFNGNTPVTNAKFSPVGDEASFIVSTDFGRQFTDGTSISINYDRITEAGSYQNQMTKITNFGAAITYDHPDDKYSAILTFISNVDSEHHNGGIQDSSQLSNPGYTQRLLLDVNTQQAETRHQQKFFQLTHFYHLTDVFNLRHEIGYDASYYKYTDESIDLSYYGPWAVDDRGIRYYNKINTFKNRFGLNISKGKMSLETGIRYDRVHFDDEFNTGIYNQLGLYGRGSVPLLSSLNIDVDGELGLGDAAGEFDLDGSVNLDLGKYFALKTGISFYRHSPSYMDQYLNLNEINIWNLDFVKPIGLTLHGQLSIPFINTTLIVDQTVENNSIYYDVNGLPTQYDQALTTTTFGVKNKIDLWIIHWENYLMAQYFSENIYGLPTLYGKSNLYIESDVFKKAMRARVGAEARVIPSYDGAGFSPVTGQFYRTEGNTTLYPSIDVYFTAKVSSFRFMARMANIASFWSNKHDILIDRYPQYDAQFRFGVSWMFLN